MNIRELRAKDLAPLLGLYTHLHEHDDPLPSEPEVQAVWTEALATRVFGTLAGGMSACWSRPAR